MESSGNYAANVFFQMLRESLLDYFWISHFPLKDDALLKLIVGLVTSCHVFDENSPVLGDKLLLLKLDTSSIRGHSFFVQWKIYFWPPMLEETYLLRYEIFELNSIRNAPLIATH